WVADPKLPRHRQHGKIGGIEVPADLHHFDKLWCNVGDEVLWSSARQGSRADLKETVARPPVVGETTQRLVLGTTAQHLFWPRPEFLQQGKKARGRALLCRVCETRSFESHKWPIVAVEGAVTPKGAEFARATKVKTEKGRFVLEIKC